MSVVTVSETPDTTPSDGIKFSHAVTLIAVGIFSTGFTQPGVFGDLPFRYLLKHELQAGATQISSFLFLTSMPWFLKLLAALMSDAFPLFATGRRHYLIVSAALAAPAWIATSFVPHQFGPLVCMCIVLNVFLMIGSTVTGGILVEVGRSTMQPGV
jgi:hypothetical protein